MFKFKKKYFEMGPPKGGWEGLSSNFCTLEVTFGPFILLFSLWFTFEPLVYFGPFRLLSDPLSYFSTLLATIQTFRLLLDPLG